MTSEDKDYYDRLRQSYLSFREGDVPDEAWRRQYVPGSFGCHELLDRLGIMISLSEDWICRSPACLLEPKWFETAMGCHEMLAELYEEVGAAHLPKVKVMGNPQP